MENVSLVDGHIDNGLSDEDIIRRLKGEIRIAKTLDRECCYNVKVDLIKDAINLIDRYKSENEKLNVELKAMRGAANSYKVAYEKSHESLQEGIELAKEVPEMIFITRTETIKEFAERLRAESYLNDGVFYIDKIVKEMIGEQNE